MRKFSKSIKTMNKQPKNISIKDCDKLCKSDEKCKYNESSHSTLELSTDLIEE